MSKSLKLAVVAALLLASSPAAMARSHTTHHARHEQDIQRSAPGYAAETPSYQNSNSGDAWLYENNHYLQMIAR